MDIKSIKMVFFSPTGTTKTITQSVVSGIGCSSAEVFDITKQESRNKTLRLTADELLVMGVPVYSGRVPLILSDWLAGIQGRNTPTVCLVTYGNREFEDALLELANRVSECGCKPVAGGAFIGEHSFSATDTPIAVARPDAEDIRQAEAFGRLVLEKLQPVSTIELLQPVRFPGNYPYKEVKPLSTDFIELTEDCTQCGLCETVCPAGAVNLAKGVVSDKDSCIFCCACIKSCPEQARIMKPGVLKDIAMRLSRNCSNRKEPQFFL